MEKKMEEKEGVVKEGVEKKAQKKLLLNKSSLKIVAFALSGQKYSSDYLRSLHVTENYVEATDGYVLVRLSHPKDDPDEFPVTPGEPFDKIGFLLPAEGIKGIEIPAKKGFSLPILSNACLSKEGEMISISTTNFETMQTIKIKPIDGEFPDTGRFIDKSIDDEKDNEWKMFTLNSDILKTLANYVSRRGGKPNIPITFWVKDPKGLVHFRFRFSDTGQDGRGVLMPMVKSDVRKGFGLV